MMPIAISALASVSALGSKPEVIWQNYLSKKPCISMTNQGDLICKLTDTDQNEIYQLKKSKNKYKNLDLSVLYAIYTAKKALQQSCWSGDDVFGINIGSSRGATGLFEKYHEEFLNNKKLSPLSSPTTTLGNISSWVADELNSTGPNISHSITCSTALHATLNAVAWITSGMCDKFLVGGSEAPLTPFTIAQMQALGIYAEGKMGDKYPCKSLDLNKQKNSMILGEGAAVMCMQNKCDDNTLATIIGVGYATEKLQHNASISPHATCIQKAMKMALKNHNKTEVDVIVTHTPGTIKGDQAEINAIKSVFGENIPALTCNKWMLGHTLATSGMLSIEFALLMMHNQFFIPVPFLKTGKHPKQINKILINAIGFGGNAVSLLLSSKKY